MRPLIERLLDGAANRSRRARMAVARRRLRPEPVVDWVLGVSSPVWVGELMRSVVAIEGLDGCRRPAAVIVEATVRDGSRTEIVARRPSGAQVVVGDEPFVDIDAANPVRRTWPADLPDDLTWRAREASRTVAKPSPGRRGLARRGRIGASSEVHVAYRAAQSPTTVDVLAQIADRCGLDPPRRQAEDVTVVCVTNRPGELARTAANFRRQVHDDKGLLVVLNTRHFDEPVVAAALAGIPAELLVLDSDRTLGDCLNVAMAAATTRFVAKFDDDDEYGPHYLSDALLAHRFAGAAVVGKHTHYGHLADGDVTVLRAAGREFRYTSHVAGGTLVIDRNRVGTARFPDLDVGEDGGFLAACERRGEAVFSADRFNYVQRRHGTNTWKVSDAEFAKGALVVSPGLALDEVFV